MPDGRTKDELVNQKSVAELSQDLSFLDSSLAACVTPSCDCLALEGTAAFLIAAVGAALLVLTQPCLRNLQNKTGSTQVHFPLSVMGGQLLQGWIWSTWYSRLYKQGFYPWWNSDVNLALEESIVQKTKRLKRSLSYKKSLPYTLPHQQKSQPGHFFTESRKQAHCTNTWWLLLNSPPTTTTPVGTLAMPVWDATIGPWKTRQILPDLSKFISQWLTPSFQWWQLLKTTALGHVCDKETARHSAKLQMCPCPCHPTPPHRFLLFALYRHTHREPAKERFNSWSERLHML